MIVEYLAGFIFAAFGAYIAVEHYIITRNRSTTPTLEPPRSGVPLSAPDTIESWIADVGTPFTYDEWRVDRDARRAVERNTATPEQWRRAINAGVMADDATRAINRLFAKALAAEPANDVDALRRKGLSGIPGLD